MKNSVIGGILSIFIIASLTACGGAVPTTTAEAPVNTDTTAESTEVVAEVPCKDGHTWVDATCTEPKTCSVCGTTEGEALGHEWKNATLEAPKTCTRCGKTEGDVVICKVLEDDQFGETDWEGKYSSKYSVLCYKFAGDECELTFFDYNYNPLNDIKLNLQHGWCFLCLFNFEEDEMLGLQTFETSEKDNKAYLKIYDAQGKELAAIEKTITDSKFNLDDWVSVKECSDRRYIAVYSGAEAEHNNTVILYYLDTQTWTLIEPDELKGVTLKEDEEIEFDTEKFSVCVRRGKDLNGYFVANVDKSKWGYTDDNFNEIAMYSDATDFNVNGYALVSEDGHSYDVIDKDFNLVAEDYIEGSGAYAIGKSSPIIIIQTSDDKDISLYIGN